MGELANVSVTAGASAPLTMTSLEIAELTGKEHGSVMGDIRTLLLELHGEENLRQFEDTHRGPADNEAHAIFRLPKREAMVLVSGYSVALRARIVDQWLTLEARALSTAETEVEALRRKAHALDRLASAEGSFCISDAAKLLQMRPKDLFALLRQRGWIYRHYGMTQDRPHSDRIAGGDLEVKATPILLSNYSTKIAEQVRITPKGLAKLAKIITRIEPTD